MANPPAGPLAAEEAEEESQEQRRVVTILFADLTNSTTLADTLDPEDVRTLLGAFFATMAREIRWHGGTVEKYIGDAVMAVFGLPLAHEDDPVRAVRAALDMQTALTRFNVERTSFDPTAAELVMRIGVNTGEVAAAATTGEGRDFLVTGDAVNIASRLQQYAAPGTILVGPRTYRSTSGAVRYRGLPAVALRGKARPVKVWEVVALVDNGPVPAPRPRGIEGLSAPIVGRDVEMELLDTLFERVMNERRPHLVTILGAPGVGKTRLAHELIQRIVGAPAIVSSDQMEMASAASSSPSVSAPRRKRASGAGVGVLQREATPALAPLVLEGRCPVYGEGITYWPLAEMLRSLCGFSALSPAHDARAHLLAAVRSALDGAGKPEDATVIAALLGHTIGIETPERRQALLPSDGAQLQESIQRAWRVFFEALSDTRGLLVLIEDIHWADDLLLDLLEYVAVRATGARLLLLCTARPELLERRPDWGGGKRNYAMIALDALSPQNTRKLVEALLPGDAIPEALRRGILDKVEGNPFYVEEIIHMFVDRGVLVSNERDMGWQVAPEYASDSEIADPAIPDSVQGVLLARLDLLSPDERDVLQHASVIGRYFWASALRGLASHLSSLDLDAVLSALRAKDLIRTSDHAKSSIAPPNEPVYTFNHNLTREVVYSTIVRTRRAHEHARVAEFLEELARGRESEFAELLAQHYQHYYTQGNLARSRNLARRMAVRQKVIFYLTLAGDQAVGRHNTAQAERFYSDTLTLLDADVEADDLALRVDLRMKRADVRWMLIRPDDAWADYHAALELWRQGSAPTEASAEQAGTPLPADWRQRGLRLYRQLVALPTRHGGLFQHRPPHEELVGYLDDGMRLAEELGERNTAEYAALLTAKAFFWWSWPEQRGERELLDALRSAREAVRLAESLEDGRVASEALDALGNIQAITTDLCGYLESQQRRLPWAESIDDPGELVDIHSEASLAYHLVGEYEQAVHQALLALDVANETEVDPLRAQALRSLALAYFEGDAWQEALAVGAQLQATTVYADLADSYRQTWAMLALAIAAARTGADETTPSARSRMPILPAPRSDYARAPHYLNVYRARLALARGATKEARQILLRAVERRSSGEGLAALLAELAELGARTGDRELYGRFGAQALELGWRSGARKAQMQATRARAIVAISDGRWEDALTDALNALQSCESLGVRWEEARTRYVLAGLYRRRGEGDDAALAQQELIRALALFEGLGAIRDMARVRAALAGGDVRLP